MSLLKCLFYLKGRTSIATAAILFGTILPILVLVCLIFVLWSRAWHSHTHTQIHREWHTGHLELAKVIYEASRDMCKHTETQHIFTCENCAYSSLVVAGSTEIPSLSRVLLFRLTWFLHPLSWTSTHMHTLNTHTHTLLTLSDSFYKHTEICTLISAVSYARGS